MKHIEQAIALAGYMGYTGLEDSNGVIRDSIKQKPSTAPYYPFHEAGMQEVEAKLKAEGHWAEYCDVLALVVEASAKEKVETKHRCEAAVKAVGLWVVKRLKPAKLKKNPKTCREVMLKYHPDVYALIMEADKKFKGMTHRCWWEVIAGTAKGEPSTCEGIEFPVMQSARRRFAFLDVPHQRAAKEGEVAPPRNQTCRWYD